MRGILIKCPFKECRKPLIKDAYLRIGSYLAVKCYHCGVLVEIRAEASNITLKIMENPNVLTDDEDSGIVFMQG